MKLSTQSTTPAGSFLNELSMSVCSRRRTSSLSGGERAWSTGGSIDSALGCTGGETSPLPPTPWSASAVKAPSGSPFFLRPHMMD